MCKNTVVPSMNSVPKCLRCVRCHRTLCMLSPNDCRFLYAEYRRSFKADNITTTYIVCRFPRGVTAYTVVLSIHVGTIVCNTTAPVNITMTYLLSAVSSSSWSPFAELENSFNNAIHQFSQYL